jgi:D-inositol-3-phosphate glycosyltransferase
MESLILTLDPKYPGGVITMQKAALAAHRQMGLSPVLGFARMGGLDRWSPTLREQTGERASISTGYLPTIEYLNYLLPAARLRQVIKRFPIIQVVSGVHSAALIPMVAGRPFVSWVATPFVDEIESRYAGEKPSLSIRLNHGLRAFNQQLEKWTFRYPRLVFALSTYTARRLTAVAGVDPARMAVLRCPIDLTQFQPLGPAWVDRPTNRYLLSVGRVDDPRKNVAALIRAYSRVAASSPDLDLVVVGKSQAPENTVTRLIESLGLSRRVHLTGHKEEAELAAIYRGAEAFVMTSRQEGLGIVVMEAQASGLPVIIMRCGGSDELVEAHEGPDRDGWLVDQGDEEGVAQAIRELAGDPALRARLAATARLRAERAYSFDLFTVQLRNAYRQVFPEVAGGLT